MAKENTCKTKIVCGSCKQHHPTCLHRDRELGTSGESRETPDPASTKCTIVCGVRGQDSGQDQSLIVPVWVSSYKNPGKEELTYVLIDCQSNATFITERLSQTLGVQGVESHLMLSTVHDEDGVVDCCKIKGLNVMDVKLQDSIPLPQTFTRQTIPFKSSQIPKPEVATCWDHLKPIASKLMPYSSDLEAGLLIGTNFPKAIKPREIIPGADNDPYGIRTDLGWGIVGRVCLSPSQDFDENPQAWTNKIVTREVTSSIAAPCNGATFAVRSQIKELFSRAQVRDMFEADFQEIRSDHRIHVLFRLKIRSSLISFKNEYTDKKTDITKCCCPCDQEMRYFPITVLWLSDAYSTSRGALEEIQPTSKITKKFMEGVIKDCAEKCPQDSEEYVRRVGKVNYIPHHGVYHPKKPGKIRVVFDCSARYPGTSLNQVLLQGPETPWHYPVMSNHQFYVNEEDRDLLRFLLWKGGDLKTRPVEYRMKIHVLGAVSSPGSANFGFKQAAKDGEQEFGADAAEFIRQNFYVDDGLKSVSTASAASKLIQESQAMCAKAGSDYTSLSATQRRGLRQFPLKIELKDYKIWTSNLTSLLLNEPWVLCGVSRRTISDSASSFKIDH